MPPKVPKKKMTGAQILESLEVLEESQTPEVDESSLNQETSTTEKPDVEVMKKKASRKKTMTETEPKLITPATSRTDRTRAKSVSEKNEAITELPKQRGRKTAAKTSTKVDSSVELVEKPEAKSIFKSKSKPPVAQKKSDLSEVESTKTIKTPKKNR